MEVEERTALPPTLSVGSEGSHYARDTISQPVTSGRYSYGRVYKLPEPMGLNGSEMNSGGGHGPGTRTLSALAPARFRRALQLYNVNGAQGSPGSCHPICCRIFQTLRALVKHDAPQLCKKQC